MTRTLVAGIGNVFFGDDGFGVAVAERLAREPLPPGVRVLDAGIRARHLAYELADGGYDSAILIDAVARDGPPGTLYVIEPTPQPPAGQELAAAAIADGHTLTPDTVLAHVRTLGRMPPRMLLVGCVPERCEESYGLSGPVSAAVEEAVALVRQLVEGR